MDKQGILTAVATLTNTVEVLNSLNKTDEVKIVVEKIMTLVSLV